MKKEILLDVLKEILLDVLNYGLALFLCAGAAVYTTKHGWEFLGIIGFIFSGLLCLTYGFKQKYNVLNDAKKAANMGTLHTVLSYKRYYNLPMKDGEKTDLETFDNMIGKINVEAMEKNAV